MGFRDNHERDEVKEPTRPKELGIKREGMERDQNGNRPCSMGKKRKKVGTTARFDEKGARKKCQKRRKDMASPPTPETGNQPTQI